MGLENEKITQQEYEANGVAAAPDRLTGSTKENKQIFDRFARNVLMERFNRLIDRLGAVTTGASGSEQIGAAPVDGLAANTVGGQIREMQGKNLHKAGAETITGEKNFAVAPILPEPAQARHPATKGYADSGFEKKADKDKVYSKTEINQAVNMTAGAVATINGLEGKGKEITLCDSGSGTITIEADPATRKIRFAARGTHVPAAHAGEHAAGGIDPIVPESIGAAVAGETNEPAEKLVKTGIYSINGGAGLPSGETAGHLYIAGRKDAVAQFYLGANGEKMFYRSAAKNGDAWQFTPWVEGYTEKNIPEKCYRAILTAAGWSTGAPYRQSVAVTGIRAADAPIADVILSADAAEAKAQLEAWGAVGRIVAGEGKIEAYCYEERPAKNMTILLKVVR